VKGNVHGLFRMRTVDGTSRDWKHYCSTYIQPLHLFTFVLEIVNLNIPSSTVQILSLVFLFYFADLAARSVHVKFNYKTMNLLLYTLCNSLMVPSQGFHFHKTTHDIGRLFWHRLLVYWVMFMNIYYIDFFHICTLKGTIARTIFWLWFYLNSFKIMRWGVNITYCLVLFYIRSRFRTCEPTVRWLKIVLTLNLAASGIDMM
jgi:hypothetical protein